MPTVLELQFHEAMLTIYKRAKNEADYTAARFLGMVSEQGGLNAARYLLHAPTVSEGYTALWQRGRLDLTVEAVILDPIWQSLFPTQSGGSRSVDCANMAMQICSPAASVRELAPT